MFDGIFSRLMDRQSSLWRKPLFFIVGLGLLLMFVQITSSILFEKTVNEAEPSLIEQYPADSPGSALAQSEARTLAFEGSEYGAAADDSFLSEYDPNAQSFLNDAVGDERPFWQITGELALKLGFVLGLIYAIVAGLRWLRSTTNGQGGIGSTGTISVLETIGLAPGRTLHVITVGGKKLLIGATEHQLTLLTELSDISPRLSDDEATLDETFDETLSTIESSMLPAADWKARVDDLRTGVQYIRQSLDQ